MKTIYIAGAIENDPDYEAKFVEADWKLWKMGWRVMNPIRLPKGMKATAYMPICLAMIDAADAVVRLRDGIESQGADLEVKYALYQGKRIYDGLEEAEAVANDD